MAVNIVGNLNRHIQAQTVRNRLHDHGLRSHRPYFGLLLTPARRAHPLAWLTARALKLFLMHRRREVCFFKDESRFTLYHLDGRRRVYQRRVECFADACIF